MKRVYGLLALGVIAFAIYISLIPFNLQLLSLEDIWARFQEIQAARSARRVSRTNFLANVLLFVPIGFGLMGALRVDRRPGARDLAAALLVVLPISIAVSFTAELLQVMAPGRVPGLVDVVAQTIGCGVGIVAWIATGPRVTMWLRGAASRHHEDRIARALTAYAAAWIFVNLAPFDITLDLERIGRRVRDFTMTPFGGGLPPTRQAWDVAAAFVSAVPLGAVGMVAGTGRARRRGSAAAFAAGALLVAGMEVAHIFIRSHSPDVSDILFGWLGVAVGSWVAHRWLARRVFVATGRGRVDWRAVGALAVWCAILTAYHWQPFDFAWDNDSIKRKLADVSLIPFAGYQSGSDLNAFNNLLTKLGLAIPVGLIACVAVRRAGVAAGGATAIVLVTAVLIFGTLELGQFFLPSRSPDPTDVLVGTLGSWTGLAAGRWLLGGSRGSDDLVIT